MSGENWYLPPEFLGVAERVKKKKGINKKKEILSEMARLSDFGMNIEETFDITFNPFKKRKW